MLTCRKGFLSSAIIITQVKFTFSDLVYVVTTGIEHIVTSTHVCI